MVVNVTITGLMPKLTKTELSLPGEIWTVSFWLRPSLKSKNKKTTHTWRKHTQRTHCKLCVYFVFVTTGEKRKNVKVGHLAYQRTTLVVSTRPWVIPLDLSSFIVLMWSYKINVIIVFLSIDYVNYFLFSVLVRTLNWLFFL